MFGPAGGCWRLRQESRKAYIATPSPKATAPRYFSTTIYAAMELLVIFALVAIAGLVILYRKKNWSKFPPLDAKKSERWIGEEKP